MDKNFSEQLFSRERKNTLQLIGGIFLTILILYFVFDLISWRFEYFTPSALPMQGREFWETPSVLIPLIEAFSDWLGFALSLAALFGTFFHYRIKKDPFFPFIGMAFLFVGLFNVFHFLSIEQLLFAFGPLSGVIACSDYFLRLALPISILVIIPFFYVTAYYKLNRCSGMLSSCAIVLLLLICLGFAFCLFNNPLLSIFSKEFPLFSLLHFLPSILIVCVVFPFVFFHYRSSPSYFAYALLLSLIPLLVIEGYSFLSAQAGFVNSLTFVNSLEILAFTLPVIGIFRDNAQFYYELKRSKEQALAATKTKNQFISSFSYHLRQPLTSILGYGQCLLDGYDGALNDKQKGSISQVLRGAKYLSSLLDEIIDISKIEEGKLLYSPSEISVNSLLGSCIDVYSPKAQQKGVALILIPLEPDTKIFVDEIRLKEILFHILTNAIEHTWTGSITLSAETEERTLHLTLTDTGEGMDEQQLSQACEPKIFPQEATGEKKVGLGLMISKKIIDAFEGRLDISSEKGKGTSVSIYIPMEKV